MSPGRRKAVPASLELSRSNLAPFDFQQSVSGQNSASGRRSFTSPSHTSSSAPVPRQPEPPHKAGPSHNSYIAVDSSEDSSDDKMRDKRQNGATRSRNNTDPASSPEMQYSPQDRSRLVGLGELATPKWASQASFSISHSSSGPIEPLPSLLPYDSPAAPSTGQMRISQSLMSLPETSPNQSPDISFNNTPISSSSSYKQHATVQNSPAPSSKSPSAAMSAIDHLLSGEFEDVDCQTDSGDLNASTRQTGTTSQRSHASRQLPQPPQTTTSRKPKSDSMLGLGFELPEGQSGPRTRQPSGPRQPPDSPAQHTTQHLKTPSEPANVFVPSPSRPHMTRQTSSQSQGSDVSHHFGSPPPPIPSPRHAEKSPRTSVHHKRQSAGATSTRSRSSSLHPQSPAHIAHAIMRTANEEGVDVDALAGYDDDTAAALRKLDGLGVSRNRARESTTSTGTHSRRGSVSSLKRSPSTESKHRRPRSKGSESGIKPPPLDPRQAEAIPAVPSPMSASSSPQVSMSMQGQPPSTANKKVRPTSEATLSDHRGSTSSASMLTMGSQTTGTHYATSRDSTSYTSNSVSSPAGRPSSKSGRRSSGGSDLSLSGLSESSAKHNTAPFESSSNSVHRNLAHLDDTSIPPVPPLPKDLESYSQPGSAVKETFKHPLDMQQVQSPVRSISFSVGDDPPLSAVTEVSSSDGSSPVLSTAASLKTPSKKWSISSALHIGRTPSTTSSTSGKLGADSSQPRMTRKSSADSAGGGSFVGSLSSRKSSSSNDIATLATARSRMPHSPSLATIASGSSSRLGSRSRKSSFESTDTAATANQSGISRTSESARKSEGVSSGIPFFARRGSSASQASQNATNSSPELSGKDPKEKSGRKSILGLNFLNRKDRKQLADADVVSPDSSVSATPRQKNRTSRISVRTSATGAELTPTSDASSVRTRLRNKVSALSMGKPNQN